MSGPRHIVVVAHTYAGHEQIVGTIAAMRYAGTLTTDEQRQPTNLPATVVAPIPTTGGIGSPAVDANGLIAYSGWAGNDVPDSAPGANDGTMATLAARQTAYPTDLTTHQGPPEGGTSPTWAADCGWVRPTGTP